MALSKETSASTISYHLLVVRLWLKVPSQPLRSPGLCPAASLRWLLGLRPLSLRKRLAGGLDGTAQPVVTSVPIHLTGELEILSENCRILSLASRDKVTGCLYDDYLCFPQILKNIGSARTSAIDTALICHRFDYRYASSSSSGQVG